MYTRREDSRLRVPSPAPTRPHFAARDAYSDDGRPRPRDPSPGGAGRLSSSAPPSGSISPYFSRRGFPDERYPDCSSHVTSVSSSYSSVGNSHRRREAAPRNSGRRRDPSPLRSGVGGSGPRYGHMTSPSPHPHGAHVNGDSPSPRSRPRSFPEPRGAYLADAPHHHGYAAYLKGRDLSSPSYAEGQGCLEDSSSLSPRGGSGVLSDEAMSSVTMTSQRVAAYAMGEGMEVGVEGGWGWSCDDPYLGWHAALTCYLCAQLFHRPRILPCGHTFCSDCLAQLKDECVRAGGRGGEVGLQLVCPVPECRYAMRLMNLARWSTRNKAVTEAVAAFRAVMDNKQDAASQTDITMESLLVTIPRSLIQDTAPPGGSGGQRGLVRRNSASLVDRIVTRAISMDSLSRSYIPQQHVTWRSYAAMLGMHILQQVIHT